MENGFTKGKARMRFAQIAGFTQKEAWNYFSQIFGLFLSSKNISSDACKGTIRNILDPA